MPTVLLINGYRFFFFSNEGNEPRHIHVEKGDVRQSIGWMLLKKSITLTLIQGRENRLRG